MFAHLFLVGLSISHLAGAIDPPKVFTTAPASPDRTARYVFYLHGAIIERMGRNAVHPEHGAYEYDAIVRKFADAGFLVISEVRTGGPVRPDEYAAKVASEVKALLGSGVPAANIAVVGHSKGGAIALLVAATLQNPGINYAIMAGCFKSSAQPGGELLKELRGRMLSIYDGSDREAGSCSALFMPSREIVLKTGLGHGVFYKPRKEWLDPVLDWIRCTDCGR